MRIIEQLALCLGLAFMAAACGSSVCDDVQSKVSACYASAECDADMSCAASKANYMEDASACDSDLVKALVESCDQATITVANQCACSIN